MTSFKSKKIYFFIVIIFFSFTLKLSAETLPAVIFKTKEPSFIDYSINNKQIINQQKIQDSSINKTSELLANYTTAQITSLSSGTAISLHGFGDNAADNTLMLVDSFRFDNPDISAPTLENIPLLGLKKIDVIPGSAGVLFGEQAVGGVVNLQTARPSEQQDHVYFYANYGSYDTENVFFNIASQVSKLFAYQINDAFKHTHGYRDNSEAVINNLTAQTDFIFDAAKIYFDNYFTTENIGLPGALTKQQVKENPRQAANDQNFLKQYTWFSTLHLNKTLTPKNDKLESFLSVRKTDGHGLLYSDFNFNRQVLFTEHRLSGKIYSATKYLLGASVESANYDFNGYSALSSSTIQSELFSRFEMNISKQLLFISGLRGAVQGNHFNTNYQNRSQLTYKALVYELSLEWKAIFQRFYLRRDGNFRFPNVDENLLIPIDIAQLKPQRGIAYEAGWEWHKLKNNIKASIYDLIIHDEIVYDATSSATQPIGANRNLSETERIGTDLSWSHQFNNGFCPTVLYSYVSPKFLSGVNKDKQVPAVSKQEARLLLNYQLSSSIALTWEQIFQSFRFPAGDDANISTKVPGYLISNIVANYNYRPFKVLFRVNNVFNKQYSSYVLFVPSNNTTYYYPAPGINASIALSVAI